MKELNKYLKEKFIVFEVNVFIVNIQNRSKYRTNEADHNDYVLDGNHYNYESLGSTEIDLSQIRQDIANLQSNKLDKAKVIDNLTTSTYNSSDPTALSAKQGKNLQDNKIDKTSIVTNLTTNDDTKVLSAKQGKNLQDNKVDKSSIVDSVTDDNVNPITSNAVFDTFSDVLDQLQSTSLLLSSDYPIIQNGQNSRLIARIYGDTTSNDNISFYEKKTGVADILLDTVPATNGVATYSYSGTGAGKKEFYVKKGSLVSEPYTVEDLLFYDNGRSGSASANWTNTSNNVTLTRETDGTVIDYTPSGVTEYPEIKPTPFASRGTTPVKITFSVLESTGQSSFQITGKKQNDSNAYYGLNMETGDWEVSIKENSLLIKANNQLKYRQSDLKSWYFGFTLASSWGSSSWKIADFKVYPNTD